VKSGKVPTRKMISTLSSKSSSTHSLTKKQQPPAAVSQRSFSEGEEFVPVCLEPPQFPEQIQRTAGTPEPVVKPIVKRQSSALGATNKIPIHEYTFKKVGSHSKLHIEKRVSSNQPTKVRKPGKPLIPPQTKKPKIIAPTAA
jgi:hypothetical protein